MSNLQNSNQFEPGTFRGALDLEINKGGKFSGVISASQSTALHPGDFVKLDTAAGSKRMSFVAAAVGDSGLIFVLFHNVRNASFSAGDDVDAVLLTPGTVQWAISNGSVTVNDMLEDTGSSTLQTKSGQKLRGYCIDPVATGQLFRYLATTIVAAS